MPKKITLEVKETVEYLRKRITSTQNLNKKSRLKTLLLIKENDISFYTELERRLKFTEKTIRGWVKKYEAGGLDDLLEIQSGGNGLKKISQNTHNAIEEKLKDPSTQITSYVELLNWVQQNYQADIEYHGLYKYCRRKFGSKLKVARKSHIKKDPKAEEVFKKTTSVIT